MGLFPPESSPKKPFRKKTKNIHAASLLHGAFPLQDLKEGPGVGDLGAGHVGDSSFVGWWMIDRWWMVMDNGDGYMVVIGDGEWWLKIKASLTMVIKHGLLVVD